MHMSVRFLVVVLLSCLSACGAPPAESVGKVSMALVGTGPRGQTYRLRDARFAITGATSLTLDSESDPSAATLSRALSRGNYQIALLSGWRLERSDDGMSFENVPAELTSSDPASFEIRTGETTTVVYRFRARGEEVVLDPGQLDVNIAVEECAPSDPSCPIGSVCDDEQVIGMGGAGRMDDFERPTSDLQVLPNPRQQDGRNGGWSWYPQQASAQIIGEGGSRVLRFAGSNPMAWSGVTLGFLGESGAGACYDGSAYQGVRFRMRGTVNAPATERFVTVAVVTAATRSRELGGDLDGVGGSFFTTVPISTTWQTVSLRWSDFRGPAWGDTQGLTTLAIDQLQALDWGVTSNATSFEVLLDDIELF
jgi:hypothetical protein